MNTSKDMNSGVPGTRRRQDGLTVRQAEVMANLQRISTDGARYAPQFRLDEKNVTVQVRSLLSQGRIKLESGHLAKVTPAEAIRPAAVDTMAAVAAMRDLLAGAET